MTTSLPRLKWLDVHDKTTPERWLASRGSKEDLAQRDPAVVAIHQNLDEATQRFGDPPRMIANRAVQLEGMLAAEGITESAPELIQVLSAAAQESGPWDGFGSICQQYFNLRQQGLGRDEALAHLKNGAKS